LRLMGTRSVPTALAKICILAGDVRALRSPRPADYPTVDHSQA
jgi:hypothetical protein